MAWDAPAVHSASLPSTEKPPSTFQEALKAGWAVITDKSAQSINQKRREGKLTMQKPGCVGLLEVDYIGTRKGYRFSVPRCAYWKIPTKIVN